MAVSLRQTVVLARRRSQLVDCFRATTTPVRPLFEADAYSGVYPSSTLAARALWSECLALIGNFDGYQYRYLLFVKESN